MGSKHPFNLALRPRVVATPWKEVIAVVGAEVADATLIYVTAVKRKSCRNSRSGRDRIKEEAKDVNVIYVQAVTAGIDCVYNS